MLRKVALTRPDGSPIGYLDAPEDCRIIRWGGSLFAETTDPNFPDEPTFVQCGPIFNTDRVLEDEPARGEKGKEQADG